MAFGTISLFILSWAGYAVFAIAGINGRDDLVTPYTTQIPVMLAKTSATWNPILYALTHPKFRYLSSNAMKILLDYMYHCLVIYNNNLMCDSITEKEKD